MKWYRLVELSGLDVNQRDRRKSGRGKKKCLIRNFLKVTVAFTAVSISHVGSSIL